LPKSITSITVDEGIVKKLKQKGRNISKICNAALLAADVENSLEIEKKQLLLEEAKKECNYQPYFDDPIMSDGAAYTLLGNRGSYYRKLTVEGIKRNYPDCNIDDLTNYLAKKYGFTSKGARSPPPLPSQSQSASPSPNPL
jgi:post-segregation antitoxin (ccd killing protein)